MKKSSIAFTLAVALAAVAAPFAGAFAAGDIASIEAVDDADQGIAFPNGSSKLVAGQDLYVRIRMVNKNWNLPGYQGSIEWKWSTMAFTEETGPALGLAVGGRRVFASYSATGPGIMASGLNGNFTDLYFKYKVQPGDVGLPVCLLRTDGTTSDSTSADFLVLNVNYPSAKISLLSDVDGSAATFSYAPESTRQTIGTGLQYSLRDLKPNAYVQSISFDEAKYGDAWRHVYKTVADPVNGYTPYIVSYGADENTVVYVWSSDDNVVVPVENALHGTTVVKVDGKPVLKVPLPASSGTSVVPFDLQGGPLAVVDGTATIYMSPVALGSYTAVGTLIEESAVAATVKIVEDPAPTVKLFFGSDPNTPEAQAATVDCQSDYTSSAAGQITIRVSPAAEKPVTVTLGAALDGFADISGILDANVLGLSENSGGTAYKDKTTTVTIPVPADAGQAMEATLNFYSLGWTEATVSSGIEFTVDGFATDDPNVVADSSTRPRLFIRKATPEVSIDIPQPVVVNSAQEKPVKVTVSDCYMAKEAGGYQFEIVPDVSDPDNVMTNGSFAVEAGADGEFTLKPAFVLTPGQTYGAKLVVTSPSGAKGSADFVIEVRKAKTLVATASSATVKEGESLEVRFEISEPYVKNTWAFLVPSEDAARIVNTNVAPFSSGVLIEAGTNVAAYAVQVKFLDGENKAVTFSTVLSDDEYTVNTNRAYASTKLRPTVTVENVAPRLTGLYFNGKRVSGSTVAGVPKGADVKMGLVVVNDVEGDLGAVNDDSSKDGIKNDSNRQFMTIWRFDDGTEDLVIYGDPSTQTVHRAFTTSTEVSVYLKDKDQKLQTVLSGEPVKTFTVPVGDEPGVRIAFKSEFDDGLWSESAPDDHSLAVKLEPAPDADVTVRLTVPKGEKGGFLKLRTDGVDVKLIEEDDDNIYYAVEFSANQANAAVLDVEDLDGTSYTRAIYVTGSVTNETASGYGSKTWAEFYKPGRSPKINIRNVAPTVARPTEEQAATTNTSVKVYSPFSVTYQVGEEVKADLEKGVKAELIVDGTTVTNEVVHDTKSHVFGQKVEFTSGGLHSVTVIFTDMDNETEEGDSSEPRTMLYQVLSTKNVMVAAHRPASPRVSSNGHSVRYSKAKGLGAGRVDGEQKPQSIKSWVSTFAVSASDSGLNVTARGYTLAAPVNDEIDSWGYTKTGAEGEKSFNYTNDVSYGAAGFDSFFYAWTCNNSKASDGLDLAGDLLIAPGAYSEYEIPLQQYDEKKTVYDNQYWEAVFSRENRKADNVGDINNDGIPDVFVSLWDFGVINRTTSTQLDGDDLASLADYNEDGDRYGKTVDADQEFTAPMEVRGVHDGLNYGMFPVTDAEGWVSDIELSAAEQAALDRCVKAHVEDGSWTGADSFDLETPEGQADAKAFIDWTWASGTEAGGWGFTVENRTDPTKEDTDGDEMPDGYEYYWWYMATVGDKDDGTGTVVGSRFNLRDLDSPTEITSKEIAEIYNPNVKRDWTKQDTDFDGLTDFEERELGTNPLHWDTDGDGISDLYEVMWSIDPLKNQNGVNGAMNADKDFMAVATFGKYAVHTLADGTSWAFKETPAVESDGEGGNTVTGKGLQVVMFDGAYMPTSESPAFGDVEYFYTDDAPPTVADPEEDESVPEISLRHYQVYNVRGFDPRTAWWIDDNGSLSHTKRWFADGAPIAGGKPANTAPYTARDEFMLLKYRYVTGLRDVEKDLADIAAEKNTVAGVLAGGCTNPNVALDSWNWTFGEKSVKYPTVHGADTDEDGVPDGWELYVGVSPSVPFTDMVNESLYNAIRDFDAEDSLSLVREFAGTDACGNYAPELANCPSIYANHPSQEASVNKGWYNKFFPTDPRDSDTDGDLINDGAEGDSWEGAFTINRWGNNQIRGKGVNFYSIYGSPEDTGEAKSLRGGGYNPCTIDTDGDALPDPWERQFSGILFHGNAVSQGDDRKVFKTGVPSSSFYDDIRASMIAYMHDFDVEEDAWYVMMGMDGTVADAYTSLAIGAADRDWDGDGLQNWQEYLVQAMRHFRYDDDKTPLLGRDCPVVDYMSQTETPGKWCAGGEDGTNRFLKVGYVWPFSTAQLKFLRDELGYENFANWALKTPNYLAQLGYFADPPKAWDHARIDLGNKYMLPRDKVQVCVAYSGTQTVPDMPVTDDDGNWLFATKSGAVFTNNVSGTVKESNGHFYAKIGGISQAVTLMTEDVEEEYTWMDRHTVETLKSAGVPLYYCTDPREWDSDGDGMDDYYELFHGLNPILGDISMSGGSVTDKDIIARALLGWVTPWQNAWIGWSNTELPDYDPIRFPWLMGISPCDADGDGLRNYEESILLNVTSPNATHTDPTPLWMTDTSVATFSEAVYSSEPVLDDEGEPVMDSNDGGETWFPLVEKDYLDEDPVQFVSSPSYTANFYENWVVTANRRYRTVNGQLQVDKFPINMISDAAWNCYGYDYISSFEENEGYDTDNDWRSDSIEQKRTAEATSDPLHFGDPLRRQSIWFGGKEEKGMAVSATPTWRNFNGVDLFKQFTVEAWVKPETAATGEDQYVVTRAVWYDGWDMPNNTPLARLNFAIGIDGEGKAFAEMENSTETTVRTTGSELVDGEWVHIAGSFDGGKLTVYVDGKPVSYMHTTIIPANGTQAIMQDPQYSGLNSARYTQLSAITALGGRPVGQSAFRLGYAAPKSWDDVADCFFRGSVDEVRLWDGAKSPGEIEAEYKVRYDADSAKAKRLQVFHAYASGARRNDNSGAEEALPAELIQHFDFSTLPGATEGDWVQGVPAGFDANVLAVVREPEGGTRLDDAIRVGWWNRLADSPVASEVYSARHVVPWIEDTMAHLPRLSGNVEDSVYISESYAGYTPASWHDLESYSFPNSMNPYGVVTHSYGGSGLGYEDEYLWSKLAMLSSQTNDTANAEPEGMITNDTVFARFLWDYRRGFSGTPDLVPLGSAFAKRLPENWDGQGAESAWAETTDDASVVDGDPDDTGIPQWAVDLGYGTYEEYLRALAKGLLPDGTVDGDFVNTEDVDKDGVPDWWEKLYDVFADGADDDTDIDGLSNYQEYLIREVYGIEKVDPGLAYSTVGQKVTDYYLRYGTLYYGELFADHDMIEDWFEDEMSPETWVGQTRLANYSRFTYDAARDTDGTGWNNWQLARDYLSGMYTSNIVTVVTNTAGAVFTNVSTVVSSEQKDRDGNPSPTIRVHVSYSGRFGNLGYGSRKHTVVVKAWGAGNAYDPSMTGSPDKVWSMAAPSQNALDVEGSARGYSATLGSVRPGRNMFVAYAVEGELAAGEEAPPYSAGMPFGVTVVDIGSQSGEAVDIEMTDFSPSMMRIDLATAIALQRLYADEMAAKDSEWWVNATTVGTDQWREYYSIMQSHYEGMRSTADRGIAPCGWATLQRSAQYCATNLTFASSNTVHVWLAQLLINGEKSVDADGNDTGLYYAPLVNLGAVDLSKHNVLTEADLVGAGVLDLGWDTLVDSYLAAGNRNKNGLVSATFGVILEKGPVEYPNANNLLLVQMVNHYEEGPAPTPVANRAVRTFSGQPTFSWTHENTIGKDYPAFQLKVWKKGGALVYDSGARRAPVRDAAGRYNWTAPLWVGAMTAANVAFSGDEEYVWDVSMLDAKFTEFNGSASKGQAFTMRDSSPSGGATDYGVIPVMVKYTGPGTVSTSAAKKCLRVEAYTAADFSGTPVGVGYVSDAANLKSTTEVSVNATVGGLPTSGEYYILAYIDTNGNMKRDDWESWGYACYYMSTGRKDIYTPRPFKAANAAAAEDCLVYVNDADTNDNMLPDVWEIEKDGKLGGSTAASAGTFSPYLSYYLDDAQKKEALSGVGSKFDAPELRGRLAFASMRAAATSGDALTAEQAFILTGVDWTKLEASPRVTITSFSLSDGIALAVDPAATVEGGEVASTEPLVVTAYVTLTVQCASDLSADAWSDVASVTLNLTLASGEQTVGADRLADVNEALRRAVGEHESGCYFRVKVEVGER